MQYGRFPFFWQAFREVSHEERVDELVRMLGGGGDHARTLAQALLQPS